MKFKKFGQKGQVLSENKIYKGPIFDLVKQVIKTPDDLTVERDLIKHGPAVNILALTPDHRIILNEEYRTGVNREVIALPAGLTDPNESDEEAVRRELREETGYQAQEVKMMTYVTSSDGFTNEMVGLALVKFDPSNQGERHFDADEYVTNHLVPFEEALQLVKDGKIFSAHSVASILYFNNFERDF
ncbi:NUDIX hydrolase [Xylocopilactobacillus apicola]|uniref:Phosphohydrolase n=1 Tax=Xylocopilactobacillus apicola TaxID=2932184 RepID=A0AAU9DBL2_9LACO|nr:NUDIX hydrolase [Xylocopilactobacillus apicola]BDR58202.1 phosphohydrolase [Xylocopilactobacillus apicola]